jgi:hypothetical protein
VLKEVELSDGAPCPVRMLGLFELDAVGPDIPGPYRYSILTYTGQVYEAEYEMPDTPPEKPDADEPEPNSLEWRQLQDHETYLCAVAHEETRARAIEEWLNNCAAYILEHCIDADDRARLVEPEDYQAVYAAATVPRLKLDDIETTLRQTFRAEFGGQEVLAALFALEPGGGKVNAVALWESQLLNALGLVSAEEEARYGQLPIADRARKVAAFKLSDWLGSLEMDRVHREAKRKSG